MATQLASAFTLEVEGVSSPSGEWTLRYRDDGVAAIVHTSGVQTWVAGAETPTAGKLRLENPNRLTVYTDEGVQWDSGLLLPAPASGDGDGDGPGSLWVTDDGDAVLINQWGLPRYSLRDGVIDPVSLGDRAPAATIQGRHYLGSAKGRHLVVRLPDGSLKSSSGFGPAMLSTMVVSMPGDHRLEADGTELTWRFLGRPGRRQWELLLLEGEQVRWNVGRPIEESPPYEDLSVTAPPVSPAPVEPASPESPYSAEWVGEDGLDVEEIGYCITAIRDVDPDEALRRIGATDDQIVTATWLQHRDRASYAGDGGDAVVAFAFGEYTVLVEDNNYRALSIPDLSRSTTSVTAFRNINGLTKFNVSRDGKTVADFDDWPSLAEGADPSVLLPPLAEMGITDPAAFDHSGEFLDDVELLCRMAGIRPSLNEVSVSARGAVVNHLSR